MPRTAKLGPNFQPVNNIVNTFATTCEPILRPGGSSVQLASRRDLTHGVVDFGPGHVGFLNTVSAPLAPKNDVTRYARNTMFQDMSPILHSYT